MKDLTENCLKCGKKEGLIFNAEIDTTEGIKNISVKLCWNCLEKRPVSEQVQEILADGVINWKNFEDEKATD